MKTCRMCLALALVCSLSLMTGCAASSHLKGERMPGFRGGPFSKVLVLAGLPSKPDRQSVENAVVKAFQEQGCAAEPSLTYLTFGETYTGEEIQQAIAGKGFDGVLVLKPVPIANIETYQSLSGPEIDDANMDMLPYMVETYEGKAFQSSGHYQENVNVYWDSALFCLKSGKLGWMGRSTTTDFVSAPNLGRSIAPTLAEELADAGLIR